MLLRRLITWKVAYQATILLKVSGLSPSSSADNAVPTLWKQTQNCVAEPANGRALTGASVTDGDKMTPEFCIAFCVSKGFKIAGIEWSKECTLPVWLQ